jgi:hypothetical protein
MWVLFIIFDDDQLALQRTALFQTSTMMVNAATLGGAGAPPTK